MVETRKKEESTEWVKIPKNLRQKDRMKLVDFCLAEFSLILLDSGSSSQVTRIEEGNEI